MNASKKIIICISSIFLATSCLSAQRHPEPARPTHVRPEPPRPRLESVEGRIRVHHRDIYLETPRHSYKLIIDERNPRLDLSRREFISWEGRTVVLEGYIDHHFEEIEVRRVVRVFRPEPSRPPKPHPRPEPAPRPRRPEPEPRPHPKPTPRPAL